MTLDPQAQAGIGQRWRRARRGSGFAAAGAADYRGTLEPVTQLEEFMPFSPGEAAD